MNDNGELMISKFSQMGKECQNESLHGHLIEVIVDTDYLDEMAGIMGDCDYLEALTGEITELEVIG
ncbi:MAG: hypothetical protein J6O18_05125 [Bacilli bacterium]|nr:hypothetical protein [Bacilli bacterium]